MTEIRECQPELEALCAALWPPQEDQAQPPAAKRPAACLDDLELLEMMSKSASGPEIDALLRGDPAARNGDRSGDDLSLCIHFAWWTNSDAAQMDRVFRCSGRMREKWDEKHFADGRTYGQATIEKAITKNGGKGYSGSGNKPKPAKQKPAAEVVVTPTAPVEPEAESDPPPTSSCRRAMYVCLGDVPARPVDYEWHRRLVRGGVNLIVGDPGMGKGFVELDIASRVTRGGDWPDNSGKATGGAVILLTAEDALAETVRPRVDRMGGDPSRIFVLEAVHTDTGNKSFNLADDLHALEEMVRETGAVMVEIDPLHAYLSAHVDSHRGSDVRGQIMAPLQALADRAHITVLLIHHLNKNAENLSSLYRASGSLDFVAAARSVMGVTFDPEDKEDDENLRRRILVTMKFNLDLLPPALGYHLTDGRVVWDAEPVNIDRRQMFRSGRAQRQPSELAERAQAFVNQHLIDGEWHETTPLVEKAAVVGVDRNAVYDALHALHAGSKRQGFPAIGCWRLPPREDEEDNPDGFPF